MSHIALSFSRLSTYEKCPRKFYAQYIDKSYPDESDKFCFVKGKKKHEQLENYIKCKALNTMLPLRYDGDVMSATPIIDSLLASGHEIIAEQQLAVDKNWEKIGWFDKKVYWRAIADFIAIKDDTAVIGDWKTGKFRDYDDSVTGQLHLAAAVVFAHYPQIQRIITSYLFIEHRQSVKRQFTRDMDLRTPFNESFVTVNEDQSFDASRNQYCNWCLIKEKCDVV